jgi:hypothetical protein
MKDTELAKALETLFRTQHNLLLTCWGRKTYLGAARSLLRIVKDDKKENKS